MVKYLDNRKNLCRLISYIVILYIRYLIFSLLRLEKKYYNKFIIYRVARNEYTIHVYVYSHLKIE